MSALGSLSDDLLLVILLKSKLSSEDILTFQIEKLVQTVDLLQAKRGPISINSVYMSSRHWGGEDLRFWKLTSVVCLCRRSIFLVSSLKTVWFVLQFFLKLGN